MSEPRAIPTKPCPRCGEAMPATRGVCPACGFMTVWFRVRLGLGCSFLLLGLLGLLLTLLLARGGGP